MKIQPVGSEIEASRVEQLRPGRISAPGTPAEAPSPQPLPRVDRVQISEAGRVLVAGVAPDGPPQAAAPLTPERIAALRQRVLDGAYDTLEVVDHVARRILQRGDL